MSIFCGYVESQWTSHNLTTYDGSTSTWGTIRHYDTFPEWQRQAPVQISSNLANHANSFPESTGFPEWFVTFFFSEMRCCQLRNIIHSIYQPLILGLFGSRPKVCSNQEKLHTLKMGIMMIMCGDIVLINIPQMIWLIPLLTKKDHWWIIIFRITHIAFFGGHPILTHQEKTNI